MSRNVTRWRNGGMIVRWPTVCELELEKGWTKVQGHQDIWSLHQALGLPS